MNTFHTLKIKEVIRETPQAVSLSFEIPANLQNEFYFEAGQYITIKAQVDGEELRRAYSLCSTPTSEEFKVTVKEVEGGKFSVLANNKLKAGDSLEVHPPEGKFKLVPSATPKTYAAFAAGSGITPILSMIKTVLQQEQHSKFILTYGNKSPEETIFFKELLELQATYPDRLFIEFTFSRSREENAQFGRIETSTVNYVLKNKFKSHTIDAYYLCGPEAMINTVSEVLTNRGVSEDTIFYELFNSTNTGEVTSNLEGQSEITIMIDDEETSFTMNQKEVILDAALEKDLDVPYSCQGGICSSCIARITEGKAEMMKNQVLTDDEIKEGLILTCQAHPLTPSIKIDFDDV
ncbi:2Fe-2S iron-sulfur cluster-binding protein [Zunongwangia sp.]|uniref:2Fe-2S iron-sulfur cluster-binding protein n=1 Tax=Zunongwangia sp. TaxID=1965325 RepID=UPI003AA7E112